MRMQDDEYDETDGMADGEGLRARSEQAIGEIAQALIDSPTFTALCRPPSAPARRRSRPSRRR